MSELHVEHHNPKHMIKALGKAKLSLWSTIKALFIDMIPVILGIVIALSFNSIKEGRKEHREETYFLERLRYDLQQDLAELKDDAQNYRYRKYAAAYLLKYNTNDNANRDSAFHYFSSLFGQTAPNITNAAYQTLMSSGKLDIIKNKQLIESLVTLYTDVTVGLKNITSSFAVF